MKTINETFTDEEHKNMSEFKGKEISWHDFILLMYVHCLDANRKGDFEIIKKNNGMSSP